MDGGHGHLITTIGETAYVYERTYHGCSQSVLGALQTHLGLGSQDSFKAASALAGGVARMGNTCGALLGGIMGIGLAFGRDVFEDAAVSQGYVRAMDLGADLCRHFEKEFGSTHCRDIQRFLFGRRFDFRDPREREEFREAGGYERASHVVLRAAELAAAIILESGYVPRSRAWTGSVVS